MLGWPLNWNMSRDIWRNDLERYEIPETDDRSPAMTWSWFTIGWRFVDEQSKVDNYFEKSYRDYMIQPFKVRSNMEVSTGICPYKVEKTVHIWLVWWIFSCICKYSLYVQRWGLKFYPFKIKYVTQKFRDLCCKVPCTKDWTILFQIWTEYNERDINDQEKGTVNYLPGMGGFLQSLLYGFAGIRIRPEMLEFHHPEEPPGAYK